MEPRIQYARTSDGVNIAYAVFGDGPPVLYLGSIPAGIHLYSHLSLSGSAIDQLISSGFRVIRYDGRGTGSSDRAARGFSLEARLCDLAAVVDRIDIQRFALLGHLDGALTAVATRRDILSASHIWCSGIRMRQLRISMSSSRGDAL